MTFIELLLIAGGALLVFSAINDESIAQTLQSIIKGNFLQSKATPSTQAGGSTP